MASKKRPPRRFLRAALKIGTGIAVVALVAVAGYLVYLDRTITSTFEGRRWSLPARVYAQPLELFPGSTLALGEVVQELERVGYQRRSDWRDTGTYQIQGQRLRVHLREFRFLERNRESMKIELQFSPAGISTITDHTNQYIPLIRLDPPSIGSIFPSHGEDRMVLNPQQVPKLLREGLKAIEDRNFDRHVGFSVRGIARAFWVNLRSGEMRQGGSTLTQQLVKSYYLDNRRTLERKLQEVAMAVILDARFSKTDLLTAYVNEIFLGQHGTRAIHGFGLGAQFYFNKPLAELAPQEVATLIAIIRGPSYYNPFRHPERALERRNRVLETFAADGLIDTETLEKALAAPLGVVAGNRKGGTYYPAFMDLVRSELDRSYDAESLSSGGLSIFTTLVPRLQEAAQAATTATLNQLEKDRNMPADTLQAAALLANSQTGELLAVVGGRQGGFDGFNRALNARRPIGSLMKPVVVLTALEQGYPLTQMVDDAPIAVTQRGSDAWTPQNFDKQFRGPVPLFRLLGDSLNVPTVRLGMDIGLQRVQDRFTALTGQSPGNPYPSFLLGAEAMSPMQVLEMYGTLASGGFHLKPKPVIAVLNNEGSTLTQHPFELEVAANQQAVEALTYALEGVMLQGTGRGSRHGGQHIAAKTGTSDDNRDSWFAAFDDRTLSVVWIGRDDNEPTGLTGSSGAMRLWDPLMSAAGLVPITHADNPLITELDYETGLRANSACARVLKLPVADPSTLRVKPGCDIKPRSITERIRNWFK